MRTEKFLQHHGVSMNPFAEEDAQTDPVFKNRCRTSTFHPVWDKVFGDPADPATSIVFGEKGAGKTAMRLQIMGKLAEHNRENPDAKIWVIEYDDFNPFLDRFADRLPARKQRDSAKVLEEWKLWDHMDAILSLGTTNLVNLILGTQGPGNAPPNQIANDLRSKLDKYQKRDLLLLSACYDDSLSESFADRTNKLRRKLWYGGWSTYATPLLGWGVSAAIAALVIYLIRNENFTALWGWLAVVLVLLGWVPWMIRWWRCHFEARGVAKNVRALKRDTSSLRRLFMRMPDRDLHGQPLPSRRRTDDRYELLAKFQGVLTSLGFNGILVLVDRVDEPHLVNGSVELMRDFVWSMLDNKFLKQPGVGLKLLLANELVEHLNRETREFHQRARIDKQNMIPSLDWTGEALYDLANARLEACAQDGATPELRTMFDDGVSDQRLIDAFRSLRTPRNLFKFLYRVIVAHCNSHTDANPVWKVPKETFESTLAVYGREQAATDRGLSVS
ncbi:hypothetical protein NG895_24900 [Aeoliella sp. ICT_H6.2]|uniref:Uncharacterized protein n=1 Tax=Aeoliella straminimaris TaxID=2954799 RepID=A0A9X2FDU7_9BACT|nr:hypothetical protein [Aeoliella straminimaris]MCO6047150.1 hypothetical protein [Aeoliella straminimaris]